MGTKATYYDVAQMYAGGARAFFAPGPPAGGERAVGGPVPVSELAGRAESLATVSAQLTDAASTQLAAEDPTLRLQASIGLLAKALTDLQISQTLFDVAQEAERKPVRGLGPKEAERSAAIWRPAGLDDTLSLLLGEEAKGAAGAVRGPVLPTTVKAARTELADDAKTTLMLIRDRAASTGWEALGGVAKLEAGKLAEAAGLVSMEAASALGQAAKLAHLQVLVRSFLGQAWASLQTLLGPALTQVVGDQVAGWIKEAGTGKKFAELVERLYGTKLTGEGLAKLATESHADLKSYIAAIQGVDALEAAYRKQIELAAKIMKAIKFVRMTPAAALPHGRLLVAAAYILLAGYIVLAGGDYVDAQHLRLLDRVPGVRKVVENNLA